MEWSESTRRSFLKRFGAAGAAALAVTKAEGLGMPAALGTQTPAAQTALTPTDQKQIATREQRMAWWHEAKFGMFIHWGLYSIIGQHEWVKEHEGVPIPQYEILAKHHHPKPNAARDWARLAKRAGQKYMVMTTKHHEGFCNWDTKLTNYNAMKQGPGRDLVREYVDAARAEGLRVGFYYSLMDWHHPDGAICKTDEAARRRFVDYTHGLIRELLTNYGKIDILWYDVSWPLNAAQWESERMNEMVFELQPDIIVNNRNGLEGDFATPEQRIQAVGSGPRVGIVHDAQRQLGIQSRRRSVEDAKDRSSTTSSPARAAAAIICSTSGPSPMAPCRRHRLRFWKPWASGWIPTARPSTAQSGATLIADASCNYTRKGNTLYVHVYNWPGHTPAAEWLDFYKPEVVVAIGGLKPKVLSARVLKTGQKG